MPFSDIALIALKSSFCSWKSGVDCKASQTDTGFLRNKSNKPVIVSSKVQRSSGYCIGYSCLKEKIRQLDRQLMSRARESAVCRQLMAIPGVDVLTALAFVTAVDDPTKFAKSRSVGAYFGLTPRRYESGEIDHNRGISKCGDGLVRTYLFEAAGTLLTRVEKWSPLKAWGLRLAKRSGLKKAKIAVARKLAVIMHRMWVDGACFRWSATEPAAAV